VPSAAAGWATASPAQGGGELLRRRHGGHRLLGFNSPTPVLYLLIIVAGATTIGTQILLYANTAQFYPLAIRSTGLGWASGWAARAPSSAPCWAVH
jgi:hypothetical protein